MPRTHKSVVIAAGAAQVAFGPNAARIGILVSCAAGANALIAFGRTATATDNDIVVTDVGGPYFIERDKLGELVLSSVSVLANVGAATIVDVAGS